jgi:hypothetical protein
MKPGFFDGISQREVAVSCGAAKLPCCYYDASAFHAAFTASTAGVAALLPDADLHPVELRRGRALVSVTALEHRRSDIGPYREVMVGAIVVFGRRPVRVLDAVAAIVRRSVSIHVLHLAVTTELARAAKVELFGLPASVAEVSFTRRGSAAQWTVADGGREVLTLASEALPPGGARRLHGTLYAAKEGALLSAQVEMNLLGLAQSFRRGAASLVLGPDHPVASTLAKLDLDGRALLLQHAARAELVLYAPHPAHVPMRRAG